MRDVFSFCFFSPSSSLNLPASNPTLLPQFCSIFSSSPFTHFLMFPSLQLFPFLYFPVVFTLFHGLIFALPFLYVIYFPATYSSLSIPNLFLSCFPFACASLIATYLSLPLLSSSALLLYLNPFLTHIFSLFPLAEWRQLATSECCRWTWRWTGWWWLRGGGRWRGRWSIRSLAPWPVRCRPSSAWPRRTWVASCPWPWWVVGCWALEVDICASMCVEISHCIKSVLKQHTYITFNMYKDNHIGHY